MTGLIAHLLWFSAVTRSSNFRCKHTRNINKINDWFLYEIYVWVKKFKINNLHTNNYSQINHYYYFFSAINGRCPNFSHSLPITLINAANNYSLEFFILNMTARILNMVQRNINKRLLTNSRDCGGTKAWRSSLCY